LQGLGTVGCTRDECEHEPGRDPAAAQTGPAGGSRLSRNASAITLREIYEAVEERSVLTLHDSPNQKCPVGKRIESVLTHVRDEADLAMKKELERTTLASIVDQLDCIDWR
jgi:DNA-binding IscR family transcriptional regulator